MRLLILGAGGHGRVVAHVAIGIGYKEIEFFDDGWPTRSSLGQWPIVGRIEDGIARNKRGELAVVAVGGNHDRRRLLRELDENCSPYLISEEAHVAEDVEIGPGSIIVTGAILHPGARIGKGVIVNTSASVDHDCSIGDYAHIAPGANLAGWVEVGALSFVGIGATVKDRVMIGPGVVVGAGATVVKDVGDDMTVVGTPARPVVRKPV